jgi:ligand-binding sensor domain-containing protein
MGFEFQTRTESQNGMTRRRITRTMISPRHNGLILVLAVVLVSASAFPTLATPRQSAGSATWTTYEPTNTGIPGNYVYSVAIDAHGNKWLASNDPIWDEGGLSRFNGKTWADFTNVDGRSPTHDVGTIHLDANGTPWVASSLGLLKLVGKKLRVVYSMANAPWPTNQVSDFAWDSKGNLWVSLADITTVRGGLARFNGSKWKVYTTANGIPWTAPWDNVESVEIDAQDHVWIGSDVLGGAEFDGTTWTWMQGGWVSDITIAPNGQPWYSFTTGGVSAWNGTKWVDHTPPVFTSGFTFVTKDRAGDMWVGTFIGSIWRYHAGAYTSIELPSLSHVYGLAFDLHNRPWAGGIGGLDGQQADGSFAVYTTSNTALPSRWIDDITVDSAGNAWFGTAGGGLSRFDGKHWADFNPYNWGSQPWPFPTDSAAGSVEDAEGNFWTTPANNGVARWDGTAWTGYLPHISLESMTRDPSGALWASGTGGLFRWNGQDWKQKKTPPSGEIGRVAADALGNIWLTTITGLEKFDGTEWITYSTSNSDIPGDYVIEVTPELSGGAVWVGTEKGLARFDGTTWTVFTKATSGVPADVINSIAIAPNGDVWVGAFDGTHFPYHGGVGVFDGTDWITYTSHNSPLRHEQVETVAVTATGDVWVGTASQGAALIHPAP